MDAIARYYEGKDNEDYGMRFAIAVSVVLHVLLLFGMYMAGLEAEKSHRPLNAISVKLGGPSSLQQSGKKRKAPVAGVQRPSRKTNAAKKKNTKKPPPQRKKRRAAPPKKNQVGLNTKKKPAKKPPPQPEEDYSDTNDAPLVPPTNDTGPRALGGFGSDGIGVTEAGDGNTDITEEDVEFMSYFRSIRAELSNHWVKTGLAGGTTRVKFHINRDGRVSDVVVVESAGRAFLDGPAQRAVLASEFPPLPQGYRGQKLIVTINFRYESQ